MGRFRIASTEEHGEHGTHVRPARRGAVDIARAFSLLLVVLGHLAMAVVDRDSSGSLRGVNIIELYPRWEWLTMLAPMPLFFAASGWANTSSSLQSALPRVRALTGLAAVVAAGWSIAALIEWTVIGDFGIVKDGARLATQPLWFLTAWVPFTVASRQLTNVARRAHLAIPVLFAFLLVTDIARFVWDAPRWIGFPGFFAAWSVPWILGAWWRFGHESHHASGFADERRRGVVLAVSSVIAAVILVKWFGYRAALIDAIPNGRSNTTPPTLFTATAACIQVGLLMVVARSLDNIALRREKFIARISAVSPGVYAWHLTAYALCGALLAAGLWTPDRMSVAWWISRPAWFAFVLSVTAILVVATQKVGSVLRGHHRAVAAPPRGTRASAGAVAAAVGAGLIGLYGPRTITLIIVTPILLATGWFSFRA